MVYYIIVNPPHFFHRFLVIALDLPGYFVSPFFTTPPVSVYLNTNTHTQTRATVSGTSCSPAPVNIATSVYFFIFFYLPSVVRSACVFPVSERPGVYIYIILGYK